jgi:hypothetical protein
VVLEDQKHQLDLVVLDYLFRPALMGQLVLVDLQLCLLDQMVPAVQYRLAPLVLELLAVLLHLLVPVVREFREYLLIHGHL